MERFDDELLRGFEAGNVPGGSFHHHDHVRVGWLYLEHWALPEVLDRFPRALRRVAANLGHPDLYHETITWAYLFLIHERRARLPGGHSWAEFEAANPDLFDWKKSVLKRCYSEETLKSDLARRVFVFPNQA